MVLLLVQRALLLDGRLPPLPLVDLERAWRALEISQSLVSEYDRLLHDVVEEHLVMGGQHQCTRLVEQVLLEP